MTSKLYCKFATMATILFVAFLHFGCSDLSHPVESTPTPSEYEYNYWLLKKTYLFEDELKDLDSDGDSVQALYKVLKDPYTRYVAPSNSESVNITLNTSIVQGDVGLEYFLDAKATHPLFIYRVYQESPAGRAGVPRYGNIIEINGVDLIMNGPYASAMSVYNTYDSVLTYNKEINLTVVHNLDTLHFSMIKEDVYAPTIFIDTVSGVTVISITGFKNTTIDKNKGTYGELKAYLDSTSNEKNPRVLNLLDNPGGHVSQCIQMADLFVSKGPLSTRSWRAFNAYGEALWRDTTLFAKAGDAGENRPFVLLVNKNSASCAEIFAAAVTEGADIPVVGETSFGKGIGQSTWQTIDKGIAIITNLEFLTPKGNSYHKKGIVPDYTCDSNNVSMQCGAEWAKKIFGSATDLKKKASNSTEILPVRRKNNDIGGAYMEGN